MKITFAAPATQQFLFKDVANNQFFVTMNGSICQKCGDDSFNMITDPLGEPYSKRSNSILANMIIKKPLPTILKIESE